MITNQIEEEVLEGLDLDWTEMLGSALKGPILKGGEPNFHIKN